MGNYNSQYASYYSTLVNKSRLSSSSRRGQSKEFKLIPTFNKKYFIKKVTTDLVGTFILLSFVFLCKVVSAPLTTAAYKYSKNVVSSDFNINAAMTDVKTFKIGNIKVFYDNNIKVLNSRLIEDKVTGWLDNIGSMISGKKSWEQLIKEEYIIPADGKVILPYGSTASSGINNGIEIAVKEGTEIKACYDGVVKECGEDKELGKYIIIAHDNNVETEYGNLSEQDVKKGDQIKKSQVIGKSGGAGSSSEPYLYFQINQMDQSINPQDYFAFTNK